MFDLGRTFLAAAARYPDRLAIVDGDVRLTYANWQTAVLRVVSGLDVIGVKKGDRVVSVLQNRWEAATLHWAAQLAGVVITPVNWRAKPEEVDYFVADADAAAIIFEDYSAAAVESSPAAQARPRIAIGNTPEGAY